MQGQNTQVNINEKSSEELAFILQEQYQSIARNQQNIWAINQVLEARLNQNQNKEEGGTKEVVVPVQNEE